MSIKIESVGTESQTLQLHIIQIDNNDDHFHIDTNGTLQKLFPGSIRLANRDIDFGCRILSSTDITGNTKTFLVSNYGTGLTQLNLMGLSSIIEYTDDECWSLTNGWTSETYIESRYTKVHFYVEGYRGRIACKFNYPTDENTYIKSGELPYNMHKYINTIRLNFEGNTVAFGTMPTEYIHIFQSILTYNEEHDQWESMLYDYSSSTDKWYLINPHIYFSVPVYSVSLQNIQVNHFMESLR